MQTQSPQGRLSKAKIYVNILLNYLFRKKERKTYKIPEHYPLTQKRKKNVWVKNFTENTFSVLKQKKGIIERQKNS